MQYYHTKLAFARGKYGYFARKMKESELRFAKNRICGGHRKKKENVKNRQKFWLQTENTCDIIKRTNHG